MSRGPQPSYKVCLDDDDDEEDRDTFSFDDHDAADRQLQRALKLSRQDYNSQYGLQDDDVQMQDVVTPQRREGPRAAAAAAAESRSRPSAQSSSASTSTGWISTTPNKERPALPAASPVKARVPIRRPDKLGTNNYTSGNNDNSSNSSSNNTTNNRNNNNSNINNSHSSVRKRAPVTTADPTPALVNVSDDEDAEERERQSGVAAPASPVQAHRLSRRPSLGRGPPSVALSPRMVNASNAAHIRVRLLPNYDQSDGSDNSDGVGGRHGRATAQQGSRRDSDGRGSPFSSPSSLPFEPDTSEGMVRPPIKTVAVSTVHAPTGYASTQRTTASRSQNIDRKVLQERNLPGGPKSASKPHCREACEPAPQLHVKCKVRCRTSPQVEHLDLASCPLKYLPPSAPCCSPVTPPKLRQRDHHVGVVLADGVPSCLLRSALLGRHYCPRPSADLCDERCRRLGLCEVSRGGDGGGDGDGVKQSCATRRRLMTQLLIRLHEWQRRHTLHCRPKMAALDPDPRHPVPAVPPPCSADYPAAITAPPMSSSARVATTSGSSTVVAAATAEDTRDAWNQLLPSSVASPPAKARTRKPRLAAAPKSTSTSTSAPAAGLAGRTRPLPSSRRRRDCGDEEDDGDPWFGFTTAQASSSATSGSTGTAVSGAKARVQTQHRWNSSRRDGHGGTDDIEEFADDDGDNNARATAAHPPRGVALVDEDDDDDVVDLDNLTPPRKKVDLDNLTSPRKKPRRPVATANVHKRRNQPDMDDFTAAASASSGSSPSTRRMRGLDNESSRASSPKRRCTSPMSRRAAEEITMVAAGGVAQGRTAQHFYGGHRNQPRYAPTAPSTLAQELSAHDSLFDDETQAESPDLGVSAIDDSTEAESIEYAMPAVRRVQDVDCPLCGKSFPQAQIEMHADTCLLMDVSVSDHPGDPLLAQYGGGRGERFRKDPDDDDKDFEPYPRGGARSSHRGKGDSPGSRSGVYQRKPIR